MAVSTYTVQLGLFDPPSEYLVLDGAARGEAEKRITACHYTHCVPSGKSHYIAFDDALVIWAIPANKNLARFLCGSPDAVVWELARLWAPDGHERNLLTRAISAATKAIRCLENPDALVSYADPNAGHSGGIYRAASWILHGRVEDTRSWRGPNGIVARRAFHSGKTFLTKAQIEALGYVEVKQEGKYRFVKPLSRAAKKLLVREHPPAKRPEPVEELDTSF